MTSYTGNKNNQIDQDLPWQKLHEADFTLEVPFQLTLADHNQVLYCEKIIRLVPRKRMVLWAKWGDQEVVAKLFFNHKEAKDASLRDSRGVKALIQANIPTPKLLYEGKAKAQDKIYITILEKIADSKNLAEIWREKKTLSDVAPLMRAVTLEIATHHVLGILQRDLHLKNFLISPKSLYSLDGSKISKYEHPIPKKLSLYYLALFFVQLGVGTFDLRQELFHVYIKSRGWIIQKKDIQYLNASIQHIAKDLNRRYLKKIFRDCTLFKNLSTWTRNIMYDREYKSPEFIEFLNTPDVYLARPTTEFLKKGRSSTVAKMIIDNRPLVVKRYNIKSKWHWLRRLFRNTRARDCWRLGQHIYMAGIPTAKPIAFIEHRFCGFRGKSYLIMEHVPGTLAQDYFTNYRRGNEHHEKTARALATVFNDLKELQLTHGDLKASNILIQQGSPCLIDLDGMRQYIFSFFFERHFSQQLKRFLKNWQNQPDLQALFSELMELPLENAEK